MDAAILEGRDIVPEVSVIREFPVARNVGESRRGGELRLAIAQLERLITAYRRNLILPR